MSGEGAQMLDREVIVSLQSAIGDSVKRIISLYLDDVPKNITEMQQALQAQDLETVARLAHSLKSSSANLGAMHLAELATTLEHSINQGETKPEAIKQSIESLVTGFDQVRPMFDDYLK